ncbi:ABC transporter ATP-binding protein [Miniphocaeibacter halophilus]|uniref:ATP-binding cassette domain-containing protein n=1 Tax=Miniphocaeibacter halophilus TaxID=2931922 RepID=A0AC61N068_9FIRM|nr:ABC transporter ATP-binding protein [Miniphocaeibacter halophilus]QQK08456.1 ATP-binding cassette domain-containing protein [Miniphocaeibacter halophilus]
MKDEILKIENLYFKYNNSNNWILENINFKLNKGDFVLLSGPSGEGKSTFLKCCNGIIPNIENGIKKGNIYIYSEDLSKYKTSEISKNIGTVLQNADEQIIFDKVEEELAFPCENLHYSKKKIEDTIREKADFMEIPLEKNTSTLSGGQKQRLITASTLVMEQKILIFDEPLANLDFKGSIKLLENLNYLCKEKGYAVIFIEHRLDLVLPYCNRIAWLNKGKIREFDSADLFKGFLDKNTNLIKTRIYGENNSRELEDKLISLENISYSKNNVEILKDINLDIYKNNKYLILGDNGSGKTTLIKIISQLLKETQGSYWQNIVKKKELGKRKWFKKLGYVFQNPNYQLHMSTVYDEINSSSISKNMTDKLMDLFDLKHLKEKHPHSLSEGQKRKVGIASILAMNPEVLLLDEPTVGQDYKSLNTLINALYELDFQNKTIITITHDSRVAKFFGDRVIWLEAGEIYKIGNKELIDEYSKN